MHEGRKQTNTWRAYAGSRLELCNALGRRRLKCHPSSRTGENPPYGMIGGIEETSASFEARSAPRSYPTIEKNALAGVNMIGSQHGGRLIRKSTSNSPRALERKKAGERRSDAKSLKRQFALRICEEFIPHSPDDTANLRAFAAIKG